MMLKQGIDLSKWNIVTDFEKVKKAGIDFVILRIGGNNGGFYKDPRFETYYAAAKKAGLKVGAYYDTGKDFISFSVGYRCADHILTLLKGHEFDYPIYADIETVATVYKVGATDAAIAFCTRLEKNGYFVGIYASDISGFKDRLQLERLQGRFTLWVARYGKKPEYVKDYSIWQKTNKGHIDGINGEVDLDECSVNFPLIMKKKGLNNIVKG
jgi:GH25 family lysozyme M1 (1,4-beta-N-acetylmuramidase)